MADNINNIFEKLTDKEKDQLWAYIIFNSDKIKEKTEHWTKEAEKARMTLTEYLGRISGADIDETPIVRKLTDEEYKRYLKMKGEKKESEFHCGVEESGFHAYNCNDCPNKCEEWHQWDKEFESAKRKKEKK